MPLAATFNALKTQIANAFNLQQAASPDLKAKIFTAALTSAVPSGIYPPMNGAPLVPAGMAGMEAQAKNAFNLQEAATPELVGQVLAGAISTLVPMVPPVGLTALQSQLKNAFNLQEAATPDLVGTIIAGAVISYYTAGGAV